ncbi:Asp-tRNA(Asn)/Glu-tRNA(Gln) amidotransferase subunit GatC [Candidatus Woesearchaeota archaeon]|jgi:aspartyl-tRNA(Asn)/glutamyl-tRNA(Gln) amidotransferase subunit C|nr:Asp-tRNA(Asn)/Glu-tRNA(Gln) amidotransferase subunit GatC [Candidatus Woesearchaeota archaeon]MBT7062509.1 Asp-tRNA(Asn)/Glu-tRNA(Gln) amidotransferase subunit GatC [Candidatus Woesearchaeota archaeon]MBT7402311.1 Asp-tRNA(Asn)/Glu-tRNA(Gln) amidotransferase subunit GatC [Candidatus Woesearchaeota archaeon]
MKINKELVKKVAKIARLTLSEQEVKQFSEDFNDILQDFSKLKKINTDNVEPSFDPIAIQNVLRLDNVERCLSNSDALSNTKSKENGFFKGPKTI